MDAGMTDAYPTVLPCVGGPFDGELLRHWQHPTDTYEVYQRVEAKGVRAAGARERTVCAWASDLPYGADPEGPYLGHYRLDFGAQAAIWVAA